MNIQSWSIEQISAAISIATPFILFAWFYYTQKQSLAKSYFNQINGVYAGFTDSVVKVDNTKRLHSGIIMNILDVDDKGYFKGQFDFKEIEVSGETDQEYIDGIYVFWGKINFEIYKDKTRHLLKPKENRVYSGSFYLIDRLDFQFENYNFETYLRAEYDLTHYREMQVLKFSLKNNYRGETLNLPQNFTLYKKAGFYFEPYTDVKSIVFKHNALSDN